ncbi:unnamed protein product [Calypogeia fissa]
MEDAPDPRTIAEARKQPDWPQWESAITSELDSLISRQVFGPITAAASDSFLTGFRWTFVKKRNAEGKVVRYKARLVARGFTQIPGQDYDLTYSPVMDVIMYRYLIAFALHHRLSMHQLDIVTAYLYGTLDKEVHMEAPPSSLSELGPSNARIRYAVKVLRSMYGLKQSGRTWYQRFKAEMLAMGFENADIAPCLFIKKQGKEIMIIAIYVDDLNLFGTNKIMMETIQLLKRVFETRDLGQTKFCLGLQFKHLPHGIFLHQSTYTRRVLKQFNMHTAKAVKSPMDLCSLDLHKDIFRKKEEEEPLLGSEKPYLSAVRALMFLANHTRPDIAFAVNLLAHHSSQPTIRH